MTSRTVALDDRPAGLLGLASPQRAMFAILMAITLCHLVNDALQALLPAIYPLLKRSFALSFGQIGLLTFTYQVTASLLQPLVGQFTDRHKLSWSLPTWNTDCAKPNWRARRCSASAPRSSTPRRRASPGCRPAAGSASRSRCSRSAATPAPRSGR